MSRISEITRSTVQKHCTLVGKAVSHGDMCHNKPDTAGPGTGTGQSPGGWQMWEPASLSAAAARGAHREARTGHEASGLGDLSMNS